MAQDVWAKGDAYEAYVGRWSTKVADAFVRRLDLPKGRRWLDAGCGTGALTAKVLELAEPQSVTGVDPSYGFLTKARARVAQASFCVGDAQALPFAAKAFDVIVSGLAINFVPDQPRALAEFARTGDTVAAYVWDYADGMQMMRYFWDAATELDPDARAIEEGLRFPLCQPDPLRRLWLDAGLRDVTVEPIEIPMVFEDFDDYWQPFLGGQGPAPAYAMSLTEQRREALREVLRQRLPHDSGRIPLTARAWAVRGSC